ncbi:MAG: lysophospholipase [Anaerolineae bacterium]|nr:lysophospholipase [Anaerolineae bacterium]
MDGDTLVVIVLQFERMLLDAQISVNADGQISGFYITLHEGPAPVVYEAPAYADPATFEEHEIVLNAGTAWELPGTLTLPVGDGPFPAVVLVHGSGPNDRDEAYGPNKVFKDLAWGLASNGIAVLRYDKRTLVHGASLDMSAFTVQDETIDDALAAVALLQTTARIDPARVYVAGHSLGAYLAPRIAAQDASIAGLIMLAGNARPLEDLILEQTEYLASPEDVVTPEDAAQIEALYALIDAIKALETPEDAGGELLFGAPAVYWLDLRAYEPVATAQALTLPMLILQGERDYQVTLTDFGLWQAELADRDNVTFATYATLNHYFISGEGPATPNEYFDPGHVAEEVVLDIVNWVLNR